MAEKQVVWSPRSKRDLGRILEYWIDHNKSTTYAEQLAQLFQEAARLIGQYPKIGNRTNSRNVRTKLVRDYSIVYKELETHVLILFIWDNRQDPKKLPKQFH